MLSIVITISRFTALSTFHQTNSSRLSDWQYVGLPQPGFTVDPALRILRFQFNRPTVVNVHDTAFTILDYKNQSDLDFLLGIYTRPQAQSLALGETCAENTSSKRLLDSRVNPRT